MAIQIQLRQGTTTEHNTFTGAVGEVTVDTTKDVPVVHDGVTVGGHPVASKANADGTISLIKKDGTSAGTINADGLFNNTLTSTNTNQALTASKGKELNDKMFGDGQTWQNVTGSRSKNTTYTNITGRPIYLKMIIADTPYQAGVALIINSIRFDYSDVPQGTRLPIDAVIPSGGTYRFEGDDTIITWAELR